MTHFVMLNKYSVHNKYAYVLYKYAAYLMYFTKIRLSQWDLFFVSCKSHRLKEVCDMLNKQFISLTFSV